jgi:hypothetical protein
MSGYVVLVEVKHDDLGGDSSDDSYEDSQLGIVVESAVYSECQCVHKLDMSHSKVIQVM